MTSARVNFSGFLLSTFIALLSLRIVVCSPLPHRPDPGSVQSTSPPLNVAPTSSILSRRSVDNVPLRFQARSLRACADEEFSELYRRKGGGGHAKAPSPPKPSKPSKPAPPPKHEAQHVAKAPKHAEAKPSKPSPPPGAKPPHKSIGQKIKEHFKRVGASIKKHFENFKVKAKAFFHKVGEGFKTVGLKIAKFAVKAASVVHTWGGKVVGLFCRPLGRAIERGAKAEGMLADKLNSLDKHQSAKERKAWSGLTKAANPVSAMGDAIISHVKPGQQKGARIGKAVLSGFLGN